MKKLVILGGGTGGTMMANKLRKDLDDDWSITIIDKDNVHYYQPGYLFVPFDISFLISRDSYSHSSLTTALNPECF